MLRWLAPLVCVTVFGPAMAQSPPRLPDRGDALVATTGTFAFYSDRTFNLHDFLVWNTLSREPVEPAPDCLAALPLEQRAAFERALEHYKVFAGRDGNRLLFALRYRLAGFGDFGDADSAAIESALAVLPPAAPAYEKCWWPAHDARNRRWIAALRRRSRPAVARRRRWLRKQHRRRQRRRSGSPAHLERQPGEPGLRGARGRVPRSVAHGVRPRSGRAALDRPRGGGEGRRRAARAEFLAHDVVLHHGQRGGSAFGPARNRLSAISLFARLVRARVARIPEAARASVAAVPRRPRAEGRSVAANRRGAQAARPRRSARRGQPHLRALQRRHHESARLLGGKRALARTGRAQTGVPRRPAPGTALGVRARARLLRQNVRERRERPRAALDALAAREAGRRRARRRGAARRRYRRARARHARVPSVLVAGARRAQSALDRKPCAAARSERGSFARAAHAALRRRARALVAGGRRRLHDSRRRLRRAQYASPADLERETGDGRQRRARGAVSTSLGDAVLVENPRSALAGAAAGVDRGVEARARGLHSALAVLYHWRGRASSARGARRARLHTVRLQRESARALADGVSRVARARLAAVRRRPRADGRGGEAARRGVAARAAALT